jgi:methyl-accepting chemotaxis protein
LKKPIIDHQSSINNQKFMLKNLSFSKKMIFLLGILSTIIIVGVGLLSYWVIKEYIEQDIDNKLAQITESAYHLVETSVDVSIRNYLRAITEKGRSMVNVYYQQYQQGILTEEEAFKRIRELILDPEYGRIGETGYLAGVNGAGVLVIHPKSEGVDASKFEFMQQAIRMKNGYLEYMWKNVDEEQERAKAGWLTYFEPWDLIIWASSYKSEFHTLVDVNDYKEDILSITLGKTGYAYIMDSKGNLIIHPTLENQNVYDFQDSKGHYFIREICDTKNGQIIYPWQNPGEKNPREKIVYYKYFEELDWIIACGVYLDELYKPVNVLIYRLIAISIGILVFVTLLSIFLGRSLTKPIKQLAEYAQSIGNGHLNVQIPFKSKDEVGYLARTFNTMSDNLRAFIGQVQQSGIQITSSATELSATARQQEAIMENQVDSTDKVLKSVNEISDVTAELVQTMQGVAFITEEKTETVSNERTDLARMQAAMHQMERASTAISNRLEAINEKAENITTVVTTITKVADQTNLLSLNAAIEAEKAGEYGRGFTVVAREIRRLADQTAVATLDIERMVKEMQSAVASGVMEMDKFIAEVRHSVEDVGKISAKLTVIIKQVQALSPSFEEVNVAMTNLSEETQETKTSLHETYFAIEQLNEAAKDLQDQVSRFKVN